MLVIEPYDSDYCYVVTPRGYFSNQLCTVSGCSIDGARGTAVSGQVTEVNSPGGHVVYIRLSSSSIEGVGRRDLNKIPLWDQLPHWSPVRPSL